MPNSLMWGVFDLREDDNDIHIVPVCIAGYPLHPHTLSYTCICKPSFEQDEGDEMIVTHREEDGKY